MGPLKLRLMDPEDKYLRELEGPDRAERAPRGEAGPKAAVVMPAALAVSLPPTPTPPPPRRSREAGAPRLARCRGWRPAPAPAAPGGTGSAPARRAWSRGASSTSTIRRSPRAGPRRMRSRSERTSRPRSAARARRCSSPAAVLFAIVAAVVVPDARRGVERR